MRSRTCLSLLGLVLLTQPFARAQESSEPHVRNIAILLYPGVELLDFAGPLEVFSSAMSPEGEHFNVYTVAESREPLVSQGCLTVVPEFTIADCPPPDLFVVPGGAVPLSRPALVAWVKQNGRDADVAMSVCNGALLFARAGLLDGLEATTHHSAIQSLTLSSPTTTVRPERRFVDNGRVVTAAGISAGIDGALHVVERLMGHESAERTAYYMEYRWDPEGAEEYHRTVIAAGATRGPASELVSIVLAQGVEAALAQLRTLAEPPSEQDLNMAGYALLQGGRLEESLRVFELNAAAFPASPNSWDSLADACLALGRDEEALDHARRCVALIDAGADIEPEYGARVRQAALEKVEHIQSGASEEGAGLWMCPPCPGDCHGQEHTTPGVCKVCGMVLVRAAEYRRQLASEASAAAEQSAHATESIAGLVADLEAGRLRPETLQTESQATSELRDPVVRRGVKSWLREHAARGELALVTEDEPGERMLLHVRVVAPESGEPLAGAQVLVYHTDADGVYAPETAGGADNPRLFGYVASDAQGELHLRTIVPGGYPNTDVPRHVHLEIRAGGRASALTEVLFADDPRLTADARLETRESGWPIVELRRTKDGGREGMVEVRAGALDSSAGG